MKSIIKNLVDEIVDKAISQTGQNINSPLPIKTSTIFSSLNIPTFPPQIIPEEKRQIEMLTMFINMEETAVVSGRVEGE